MRDASDSPRVPEAAQPEKVLVCAPDKERPDAREEGRASLCEFTVELGEPAAGINARRASILLDGIPVFEEIVYDTEADGQRTEEQAALNIKRIFAGRLSRLLENE